MEATPRHQCLVYDGAPNLYLRQLAEAIRDRLTRHYRCLYLNSPPMLAGMRSYLAAQGVDVDRAEGVGSLVLSAERPHLIAGRFDVDAMLAGLESELKRALEDDYAGLWATGDMTWELGGERDLTKLMEYEERLDEFMRFHPELSGICQYHSASLPRDAAALALESHPAIFLNATLSIVNPEYYGAGFWADK